MRNRLLAITRLLKRKATAMLLFSYGILFGTFSPFLMSGCGSNCGSCGNCGLMLGILPLVLFMVFKNRITGGWRQLVSFARAKSAKGGI
jgi:hypothetical protein